MNVEELFFRCPCCEKQTLSEKPPGTFEICRECGWEDDNIQYEDPEYKGGANSMSLNQARSAYKKGKEIV